MPKRAAENGADASAKKAKKAPKNVGDDIIKLESDSEGDGIPVPVAKKAAKKAAQKKLEDAVLAADAVDPSEALAPFLARPYAKNGLSVTVHPVTDAAKDLTPEDKKWIWNLLEKNMRPVYGPSAWKKEGKEKKAEMDSEEARYLVAREHAPRRGL